MAIPFAALAGVGTNLLGVLSQAGAQRDQFAIQGANLNFQRQQAQRQEQLAKEGQTDAYGNRTRYVPGQGYVVDTTDLTQAILDAGQRDEAARLQQDAPRQREARVRADDRSIEGDARFNELFAQEVERYRPSVETSQAETIIDALRIAAERRNNNSGPANLARMALRTGNSGELSKLAGAAQDNMPGLVETMIRAKEAGTQKNYQERSQEAALAQQEMQTPLVVAQSAPMGQTAGTNADASLSRMAQSSGQQLANVIARGGQGVSAAMSSAATAAGRSPNYGALAASIAGLEFPKEETKTPQMTQLEQLLIQEQISKAQLGHRKNTKALSELYNGSQGDF